jgi:hypothetical protein
VTRASSATLGISQKSAESVTEKHTHLGCNHASPPTFKLTAASEEAAAFPLQAGKDNLAERSEMEGAGVRR